MDQLIAEKNFQKLEEDFLSCGDMSHPNDTWVFTQKLMSILDSIVQYNNQVPGMKNIQQVCQYVTNPSMTPYQGLVRLVQVRINVHFCIKWMCRKYRVIIKSLSSLRNTRTNEWTNERKNKRANERTSERTNNERMSEWASEWMNEWMNEWTTLCETSRLNHI